jgi:hypothetical protein
MSSEPRSDRQYLGQFGVTTVYPKTLLKAGADGAGAVEAATVSLVLPLSEAMKLVEAIESAVALRQTGNGGPEDVEIKVDRRDEKKKSSGLYPATVTWL